MKRILVPVDFSPASEQALEQARELARAFGAEVHLLHKVVYPPPRPPTEVLDRLDDAAQFEYVLKEVIERPEREAQESLEARRRKLELQGIAVTVHLDKSGEPFERIERAIESWKPDLLVMGTHGRTGLRKWLMGSIAEKALRHASIDVLTLHDDSPIARADRGFGEIVVATDFSSGAQRALEAARRIASALRGSVGLVHVLETRFAPSRGADEPSIIPATDELRAQARRLLEAQRASEAEALILAEGDPVHEIDRVANERGASLVCIGTQGLTGVRRALLGSVAEKLARFCHRPVLTVR
jgi:nucleotide-binding universal stress UspA family protein